MTDFNSEYQSKKKKKVSMKPVIFNIKLRIMQHGLTLFLNTWCESVCGDCS